MHKPKQIYIYTWMVNVYNSSYLPSSLFVTVKPFVNPFSRSKEKK